MKMRVRQTDKRGGIELEFDEPPTTQSKFKLVQGKPATLSEEVEQVVTAVLFACGSERVATFTHACQFAAQRKKKFNVKTALVFAKHRRFAFESATGGSVQKDMINVFANDLRRELTVFFRYLGYK